jgi:streptomycin 6-kinase
MSPALDPIPVPDGLSWWRSHPDGAAWLTELPGLVAGCVDDWGLTLSPPFEPAAISWVAPAELPDGTRAVLKVNFPEPESEHEADALQWWAGDGAVRLLAQDRNRRALLIARCDPGAQLRHVPDEPAANRIAAGVLRRLWKPAPPDDAGYRTLAEESRRWADELPRRWERHGRPVPREVLEEAVALCAELGDSQPELVVCHQDFHGGNVLSVAGGGWLAIDPKPLIGERAFDLASLLRDRRPALLSGPHPERVVRERLEQLCGELEVDRERARGWALVHALAWGMSDEDATPDLLECAQLFAAA